MRLDDTLANAQTNTKSLSLGSHEGLEQTIDHIYAATRPHIFDLNRYPPFFTIPDSEIDYASRLRHFLQCIHCISHQID